MSTIPAAASHPGPNLAPTIRVHFVPYWSGNPYQPMLAAALEREGVAIERAGNLKMITRASDSHDSPPEVVHLHWLPKAGYSFMRLAKWFHFQQRIATLHRRGVPLVWTAHNLVPHDSSTPKLDLWLSRNISQKADRIICHSAAAKNEVVKRLLFTNSSKATVIPHGNYIGCYPENLTSSDCRRRLDLPEDSMVFLFFGQIRPYKGVLELIAAFRRIPNARARLVLAGRPLDAAMTSLVNHQIAGDRRIVFKPGFVPDVDIQVYMHSADAVVFPYEKSLTSGALILAMSFGRAAIAARHPGTVDTVTSKGGVLYDATETNGLFEALESSVQCRLELSEMGKNNRQRALTWDWNSVARQTAYLYREVTAKGFSSARRA